MGNYYGAVHQFIQLQNDGEALYFIANLHALSTIRDAHALREYTLEAALAYLSLGLDPNRAILFRQSDIPEITELFWILGSLVPISNLERAHSYKDKIARGVPANFGLFAYPVLMAADILAFGADVVPVGKDQDPAPRVRARLGHAIQYDLRRRLRPAGSASERARPCAGHPQATDARVPERAAVVPGTDGQKMSKSAGNTIELFATDAEVRQQIMGIRTDSTPLESPKPIDNALYGLLAIMAPPDEFAQLDASWRAGGKGYAEYKKDAARIFPCDVRCSATAPRRAAPGSGRSGAHPRRRRPTRSRDRHADHGTGPPCGRHPLTGRIART